MERLEALSERVASLEERILAGLPQWEGERGAAALERALREARDMEGLLGKQARIALRWQLLADGANQGDASQLKALVQECAYTGALEKGRRAIARFGSEVGLERWERAQLYLQLEESAESRMEYARIVLQESGDPVSRGFARIELARALWESGRKEEARAWLGETLRMYSDEPRFGGIRTTAETLVEQMQQGR